MGWAPAVQIIALVDVLAAIPVLQWLSQISSVPCPSIAYQAISFHCLSGLTKHRHAEGIAHATCSLLSFQL